MQHYIKIMVWFALAWTNSICDGFEDTPKYDSQIAPLLKSHCVKCHGPAKQEGVLDLSTAFLLSRGNESGAVVIPHDLEASRLWTQVQSDAMPPESPLAAEQKELLRKWILAGAPGLFAAANSVEPGKHWAFRPLSSAKIPDVVQSEGIGNEIDCFVQSKLESQHINPNFLADKQMLIRRVSLDVTGLPPTLEEIESYLADINEDAYSRMVDRYLASPQFGVRWGKHWLDAAGYADSNGYFNADSDRPLAYRYRDYVVRNINRDKPFDRFILEQLAGDELEPFESGQIATANNIELLEATHFLRNGQDGSGESDGNPDEVRADRYYALESVMQNTSSALLGLTIQCAKCHDHKFEPLSQLDYYRWQAIFYPTFHIERWVNPKDRVIYAPLAGEQELWEQQTREAKLTVVKLRDELSEWMRAHRLRGDVLFEDNFDGGSSKVVDQWSATAPGDDLPGGTVSVNLDKDSPPSALVRDKQLWIIEGGTQGDSWLSTRSKFDWTPNQVGDSIQVTFDLVDNKVTTDGAPAARIGYFIALHDFDDSSSTTGGNLLIDGNPTGGSAVHLDYPGADSRPIGTLGTTGYKPGQNYGVRVTSIDKGKFRIEHLVNSFSEEKPIDVKQEDLPDGGFGFEYCCGRSFVIDNVLIEYFSASQNKDPVLAELKQRRDALASATKRQKDLAENRPGKIAWGGDMSAELPEVHLLTRGNYSSPAEVVEPDVFSALVDNTIPFAVSPTRANPHSSGRRLAWARWVTTPDSKAAALMARVQVNRLWQHYFGKGIVATPDNFGISGTPPTHPELLDWLAAELIGNNWSMKSIHRVVLHSATYRRSSQLQKEAYELDPSNRLLWRFAPRRLDAETIRDQILAVSGDLELSLGGPSIATKRLETGEVVVAQGTVGALRRSLYLNQKRTQVVSFLSIFDAPSIVFNSVRRNTSTMSLQSLSLLNSEFMVERSKSAVLRLAGECVSDSERAKAAFQLFYGRSPNSTEIENVKRFLDEQIIHYSGSEDARDRAWQDFCQAMMASSEFLYVE